MGGATTVTSLGNIYLQSLLWLTPDNPFGAGASTSVTYSFGRAQPYTIHDPESSVDSLQATSWNTALSAPTSLALPNGDVVTIPKGLNAEQAAVYVALQAWIAPTNLQLAASKTFDAATFKFLVTDESGMRDFWSGEHGVLGFAELPNDYGPNYGYYAPGEQLYSPGVAVFNQDGTGWTAEGLKPGGYGYVTVLHEIGHLFGLDHPWNEGGFYTEGGTRFPEPYFPGAVSTYKTGTNGLNQGVYTTMTYNDGWSGQPAKSLDFGYQAAPGAFDIAAMQHLYGQNTRYRAGDDTYYLPGADTAGTGWMALWDAGGMDTIAVRSGVTAAATIDLRDATLVEGDAGAGGYVSWVKGVAGGFTIAHGGASNAIEKATGGQGDDTLIGNEFGNMLRGNGGADAIQGYAGADQLWGGAGPDTFIFRSLADFRLPDTATAVSDTVLDFVSGIDTLDFRAFDVDPRASGLQPANFRFDGNDKSFVAGDRVIGELAYDTVDHALLGDVNNDGKADFELLLQGVAQLTSKDFLL